MRKAARLGSVFAGLLLALLTACDDYPKDPHGTLAHAQGGTIKAGIVENAPWTVRNNGEARGIEVQLVEQFVSSLGGKVEWSEMSGPVAMRALKTRKLDLVVGGFLQTDSWRSEVGFTRAYIPGTKHVMAVPKGENAWLIALETFLRKHESEILDLTAEARQ
ncbi:transporter substrate-binding domain-containing protein [Parvibaculum sp.]|uniref:transporter substrate-binding domain-containing protein n=1 Tax=Parvibaculum sp. TaxID=2024848 RepID=UPI003BA90086